MTWTYELSTIATTPKDMIRLQIGDTDSTNPLLQDEEISFYLTTRANIYGAAAECCRSLAAKFSSQVTAAAGGQKTAYSDIAKAYAARAVSFDVKAAMAGSAMPYAGGISVSDKQNNQQDTDRTSPQFSIGMDDNFMPISPVDEGGGTEAIDPNTDSGT